MEVPEFISEGGGGEILPRRAKRRRATSKVMISHHKKLFARSSKIIASKFTSLIQNEMFRPFLYRTQGFTGR